MLSSLPNLLTLSRILAVPILVVLMWGKGPYEWLAAFVGRIAAWFGGGANGDVSRNQTGLVVQGIKPPRNRAYWMNDYATRDAFLKSGLRGDD